jgi:DNA-binding NarL/FixJ family response regulator
MSQCDGRRAVLVDHHPLWLDAVEPIVESVGLKVVGKSTSGRGGLDLVMEHEPDVLVTGIVMPDGELDGIELTRRATDRHPSLKAIILSMYDDTKHVDAALAAGAVAYVIKTAHPDDLRSAIRQAFSHSIYLPGRVAQSAPSAPVEKNDLADLTRRELEILRLVAEGYSNSQLARMLWVTEQTVKFHLSNIYRKLDVSNRTEASRRAQLNGLLATPAPATSQVA